MNNKSPLISRRRLLQASGLGLGAAALNLSPAGQLLTQAGSSSLVQPGYGPLRAVNDLNTGLPLLKLPSGFSYTTFGWTAEPLVGDRGCPNKHPAS